MASGYFYVRLADVHSYIIDVYSLKSRITNIDSWHMKKSCLEVTSGDVRVHYWSQVWKSCTAQGWEQSFYQGFQKYQTQHVHSWTVVTIPWPHPRRPSNDHHFCSWMWCHIHELHRQSYGTHSLTHSILINLFIKVKLNTFSPTSPAKYCFCPIHFLAYVWLVCQGTREG